MATRWSAALFLVLNAAIHLCPGVSVKPKCDVSGGSWNQSTNKYPAFPNPDSFGCDFRKQKSYLQYAWQAPPCKIATFQTKPFLSLLRGKVLLIIGDSISKNLYSAIHWAVAAAGVTLKPYPVPAKPRLPSGTVDGLVAPDFGGATIVRVYSTFFVNFTGNEAAVYLDQVEPLWTTYLPKSDFAVFAGFHHLYHNNIAYYLQGKLQAGLPPPDAIYEAAKTVRDYVAAHNYKGMPMVLTYTPSHVRDTYIPGGKQSCGFAQGPFSPAEYTISMQTTPYTHVRDLQFKVFSSSPTIKLLDITRLSLFRPDGHSGSGSGLRLPDCAHWCVPGVPNTWTDLMFSAMQNLL